MFIAIIGTASAGKSTVEDYLVAKEGFTPIRLSKGTNADVCIHSAPSAMLDYVTRNWRTRFVTVDLCTREHVQRFIKRPFFMLLSVDAPILDRMHDMVHIKIINDFRTVSALHSHLNDLNILDPSHLRPDWDTYFMTLASLAAERSNCMKRRVGAILVRDNRILSTGYNGTPRHLLNCNEGGCSHCNGTIVLSDDTDHCICLHAEENALLEAGRERVGIGSVLYCNTCPCLKCTIKIIQTGVTAVVYNLSYKVDAASAQLFKQAGVQLRRHRLPGQDGHPFDLNGVEQV
ncbi:hypothetical protein ARMGADRAFT_916800 [Armillaria gallica]|uniref:Deoxycytidylate deaminase n=1 Tax=Armillaria gallica TaxID=47427 RepID=A0A2H3E343_ARMGA|nr:hypothetical protein ARMGADRAFT_916800 [Armillaria gallica]